MDKHDIFLSTVWWWTETSRTERSTIIASLLSVCLIFGEFKAPTVLAKVEHLWIAISIYHQIISERRWNMNTQMSGPSHVTAGWKIGNVMMWVNLSSNICILRITYAESPEYFGPSTCMVTSKYSIYIYAVTRDILFPYMDQLVRTSAFPIGFLT